MSQEDKHSPNSHPNPQRIGDILPDVLDAIEGRAPMPAERSENASIDYEQSNNAALRESAQKPGADDETVAELSELIHEGEVAIEALKRGEGHSPLKPE